MTINAIERLEKRLADNAKIVKTYKTHDAALRAAVKVAKNAAIFYETEAEPEFMVTWLPNTEKFTVFFNFTKYASRNDISGYVGFICDQKFVQI